MLKHLISSVCKLTIIITILTNITCLNAKKLYLDIGSSMDFASIKFQDDKYEDKLAGVTTPYRLALPNFGYKVGYRVSEKFILVLDHSRLKLNETFNYNTQHVTMIGNEYTRHYTRSYCSISNYGVGIIYYIAPCIQASTSLGIARQRTRVKYNDRDGKYLSGDDDVFSETISCTIAYDIPIKKLGLLLGASYFYAPKFKEATVKNYLGEVLPRSIEDNSVSSFGIYTKIRY